MTKNSKNIQLAVGAGSAASLRFIREQVLTRFANPILNQMEDGALVAVPSQNIVVTTDTHLIDPPIFPGGDIGKLAISGTVNDLVVSGAKPIYLSMGLVLAEGFPYETLERILDSVAKTVEDESLLIVTGDTKVIEKSAFSSIIINTTGLGIPLKPDNTYTLSNAKIGDKILVNGTLGDHALAVLSLREGLGFEQRVKSDCVPLTSLLIPVLDKFENIRCLRDLTRGGLLNALSDLAEASQMRVSIDRDSVPIQKEVQMGCEMLGLDPLRMVNEGKVILVVAEEEADAVLTKLKQHPHGTQSAVIGEIGPSKSLHGEVIIKEQGKLKIQTRPEGDTIPRLC